MRFPAEITSSCIWLAIAVSWVISHWYACGADGRAGGRTVTWLPNFLGWVDFLPKVLRCARFAIISEHFEQVKHQFVWPDMLAKRLITEERDNFELFNFFWIDVVLIEVCLLWNTRKPPSCSTLQHHFKFYCLKSFFRFYSHMTSRSIHTNKCCPDISNR